MLLATPLESIPGVSGSLSQSRCFEAPASRDCETHSDTPLFSINQTQPGRCGQVDHGWRVGRCKHVRVRTHGVTTHGVAVGAAGVVNFDTWGKSILKTSVVGACVGRSVVVVVVVFVGSIDHYATIKSCRYTLHSASPSFKCEVCRSLCIVEAIRALVGFRNTDSVHVALQQIAVTTPQLCKHTIVAPVAKALRSFAVGAFVVPVFLGTLVLPLSAHASAYRRRWDGRSVLWSVQLWGARRNLAPVAERDSCFAGKCICTFSSLAEKLSAGEHHPSVVNGADGAGGLEQGSGQARIFLGREGLFFKSGKTPGLLPGRGPREKKSWLAPWPWHARKKSWLARWSHAREKKNPGLLVGAGHTKNPGLLAKPLLALPVLGGDEGEILRAGIEGEGEQHRVTQQLFITEACAQLFMYTQLLPDRLRHFVEVFMAGLCVLRRVLQRGHEDNLRRLRRRHQRPRGAERITHQHFVPLQPLCRLHRRAESADEVGAVRPFLPGKLHSRRRVVLGEVQ
eukprot:gene1715-biopygen21390